MTEEKKPHPGEAHRFVITCEGCGVPGHLNLAILAPDDRLSIETVEPPTPIEDLVIDHIEPPDWTEPQSLRPSKGGRA